MLYNLPFVPGVKTPLARAQIGYLVPDAASIQVKDTTHVDRIHSSGFGGGTRVLFKGYTITGTVTAYVARSDTSPHTLSSNVPARFSRPLFRLWIGGYYAEGIGAITDISITGVTKQFTVIDIAFESDGHWTSIPNVVELA
jgi:hypothetical protein